MRQAKVLYNDIIAGLLIETDAAEYIFQYDGDYFLNTAYPPISIAFPKTKQQYSSNMLFPFFYNMLSEGANLKLQSRMLQIDEDDHFGVLLKTAAHETIGAITVVAIND